MSTHPLSNSTTFGNRRRASTARSIPNYGTEFQSELLLSYDFPINPDSTVIRNHTGSGSGRRIFIGPTSLVIIKGKSRSNSTSSSKLDSIVDYTDNRSERSHESEEESRSKRSHRVMRNVSYTEPVASSNELKSWIGGSFEVGGEIRQRRLEATRAIETARTTASRPNLLPTLDVPIPEEIKKYRERAETIGSSYRSVLSAFPGRKRSDTLATFKSALTHQEPSPAHSRSSSTISLAVNPTSSRPTTPTFLPIPLFRRSSLRSASESLPYVPPSPSKSILRSASLSYPNNTRPFLPQPFQPQPSKLSAPPLGVRRTPSTHFGDENVSEIINNTRTELNRNNVVEEPEELNAIKLNKVEPPPSDIIRLERMIIRSEWTAREDLPDSFDDNTSRTFITERRGSWEEVLVVWKKERLEIYTDYTFPIFGTKKLRHIVPLSNRTRLSLFSSTDLVFCLTYRPTSTSVFHSFSHDEKGIEAKKASKRGYVHSRNDGTNIFIMKARTFSIAKEWIFLLYLELGGTIPSFLDISVPGLGASIKIPIPVDLPIQRPSIGINSGTTQEKEENRIGQGYKSLLARDVVKACLEQLIKIPEWSQLLQDAEIKGVECKLVWRRGKILDWVEGDQSWSVLAGHALRQPHLETVLELRPAKHFSTFISLRQKAPRESILLSEPPGIEGYLYRNKPKGGTERVYLSSHDNYLFISSPNRAYPPDPPTLPLLISNPATLVSAPFSNPGKITPSRTRAASESWGRAFSKKIIDLLDVETEITENPIEKLERLEKRRAQDQIMSTHGYVNCDDIVDVTIANEGSLDSSFEMTLKSGRKCYSNGLAAEWTGRLQASMKYWKRRGEMELRDMMELQQGGPSQSQRLRPGEQPKPHEASCPDLAESSSPLLSGVYNRCIVEGCRPITRSSQFFVKEGLRGMFKNRFCFLIDGHLLEYDVRRRDIYGQALETVYHHRRFAFSLRDCYIYSGTLATSVLGPDTSGSDWRLSNSAENFPRIFENGLMSHDSTIDCSFVIWKKLRARGKAGKGLGSSSTVRVYRTRNKTERDEWIFALNAAIELLYKKPREALREEKLKEFTWLN